MTITKTKQEIHKKKTAEIKAQKIQHFFREEKKNNDYAIEWWWWLKNEFSNRSKTANELITIVQQHQQTEAISIRRQIVRLPV